MELLVVLTIIAILTAISLPAINSVLNAYKLSGAEQSVLGQLAYARQSALASNRVVEVRFYQIADYKGAPVFGALQAFQENINSSGAQIYVPVTKPYFFPTPITIFNVNDTSLNLPSVLSTSGTLVSGATAVTSGDSTNPLPPPNGAAPYTCFHFRPSGQTDLTFTSNLTLASETASVVANNLPANFITIQIDSINGSVKVFHP